MTKAIPVIDMWSPVVPSRVETFGRLPRSQRAPQEHLNELPLRPELKGKWLHDNALIALSMDF